MRVFLLNLLFWMLLAGCAGTAAAYPMSVPETLPVQAPTPIMQPIPMQLSLSAPLETEPAAVPIHPTVEKRDSPPAPMQMEPPAASPAPPVYAYGPVEFPSNINPLTGLPVEDPAILDRRPMAIKVTNFPRSVRPQWGLSLADHIYEYYIGDQMSRFIGIFYGEDASQVGPIRSARLFDEQVLRMYDAIFVFGWADDPVVERLTEPDIRNRLVIERENNCPPLCRLKSGHGYNNLFADTSLLSQYIHERGTTNDRQELDGLRFEMKTPKSGNPGLGFSIRYSLVSYSRWEYDPASGRYLRFQEAEDDHGQEKRYEPLMDSLTGVQLSADNVVILYTDHQVFYQSSSTTIYDMPFTGRGNGYAFRDGKLYPVNWSRAAAGQIPSLSLPDGRLYPLKPGNLWFEILGLTSTLAPESEGSWSFAFSIP